MPVILFSSMARRNLQRISNEFSESILENVPDRAPEVILQIILEKKNLWGIPDITARWISGRFPLDIHEFLKHFKDDFFLFLEMFLVELLRNSWWSFWKKLWCISWQNPRRNCWRNLWKFGGFLSNFRENFKKNSCCISGQIF